MKVIKIRIPYDWEDIDLENDNVDVFVETDDGYTYTLSLATPKNLQFLMDKKKMEYERQVYTFLSGYPFIVVNQLTPKIVEQAVKAFTEKDGGYWLKVYHFGGCSGILDERIFDQLKAKHLEKRKQVAKLDAVDLIGEAKSTLKNPVNERNLMYLVKQYQSGNKHPGIKTRAVPGTCLRELRVKGGDRIYLQEKNDKIKVVAISDKDNQDQVSCTLTDSYLEENTV